MITLVCLCFVLLLVAGVPVAILLGLTTILALALFQPETPSIP